MAGSPRVAVAGMGFIGAVHVRAALRAGVSVIGVAAGSIDSAREAAQRLGVDHVYESAEALIDDPAVEVVHICTPNHLHEPLALRALAAGKHVICEKPLATDRDGAQRLVDAARRAGVHAAVPFVYRFYPTVREARHRVRSGETGRIVLLHGAYLQDWLLEPSDDNWRVDAALGGASRAFADIGSHWCDLAEFVSGQRLARVSARLSTTLPERPRQARRAAFARGDGEDGELRAVTTEDAAAVQFETDGGALGTLLVSQVSAGHKNSLRLEIDGAREAIAFDQEDAEVLWCGRRDHVTLRRRDATVLSPDAARLSVLPAGHPQGYQDCFDLFVADVYEAIRTGTPPEGLPQFADGLRAAQITDAVLRSAREGRWVDVDAAPRPLEALY